MMMLFAERGLQVSACNAKDENVDDLQPVLERSLAKDLHSHITGFKNFGKFMLSFDGCDSELKDGSKAKPMLFGLPHGPVAADSVLKRVRGYFPQGNIRPQHGDNAYSRRAALCVSPLVFPGATC